MTELFENPLVISAAGGILALLSGFVGFMIRSAKTYSKPMARILGFDNRHLTGSKVVTLDEELIQTLSSIRSAVFTTSKNVSIADLVQTKDLLTRWEHAVPNFKQDVEFYINTIENNQTRDGETSALVLRAIREVLAYKILDGVLVATIGNAYLRIPKPEENTEQTIKVDASKSAGGCYLAYLPDPCAIGRELDTDPANKHYYKDFADLVASAEHTKLIQVFSQLVEILTSDLPALKDSKKSIEEIVSKYEIYSASIYFANITNAPILIEPRALLEVEGVKTSKGPVTAQMRLLKEEVHNNGTHRIPIEDAVVVPSGSDLRLFAHTETRIEIENGSVIQGVYSDGSSKARISLTTESVGLFNKKNIATTSRRFH